VVLLATSWPCSIDRDCIDVQEWHMSHNVALKKSSGAWSQQRDLTKRRKRAQGPEGAGLNLLAIGHWPLRPNKLWDAKWWHMTKASPRIWFLFDPICLFVLSLPMMLGLRVCHSMSRTRKRGKRVSKMVYIMFCPSFLGVQFFYLSGGCF
jgi:hypothetical protein